MKQTVSIFAMLVFAIAFMTPQASAQVVLTGEAGGAFFKFAVPPAWSGDLVIWNDGLRLAPNVPFTVDPSNPLAGLGALAPIQFSQGFAIATTSRRQVGWAVFKSNNDLHTMMDVFAGLFGSPGRIFLTGGSLGGLVAIQAIETAHLGNVVGGLSLCGALAGSRVWDTALDMRLVYDNVCSSVPGAAIPGGAEGLPAGSTITQTQVALAANQCTGVLLPPALRTPDQQARFSTILNITKLPESFFLRDMVFVTHGMADLVHDQTKLNGKIGTQNLTVDYEDPVINATIKRVSGDVGASHRLVKNYTPSGDIGGTRIVSLHTDKDGLVIVENETAYRSVVPASNFTSAVAVEGTPSHCGFTPAEVVAGWESLRAWVSGAPQPTPGSIQATCQVVAPIVGGACRIDPAFVLPDPDGRMRPR